MTFAKIKQERLSDVIARELEAMIMEGVLAPGDRLPPERELAQEFSVSRPSLRQALQKLETAGLVETRHGGGTFVRDAIAPGLADSLAEVFQRHPEAAIDFIELRATLDGMSAAYAAARGTEDDRAAIAERFQAIEAAHSLDDPSEEAERDADFHIAIAEASHNVILLHVVRGLLDLLRKDVIFNRNTLYERSGARDALLVQHREIHDAIMGRDPERARRAAAAHMAHVDVVLRDRQRADARADVAHRRLARYLAGRSRAGAAAPAR
ncbi:MAG: GntR family transcriptional regulator [Rhodospirillales bacterium]|nr:GntR family transcriptional regulator [Rhodospirillales bacterium]